MKKTVTTDDEITFGIDVMKQSEYDKLEEQWWKNKKKKDK